MRAHVIRHAFSVLGLFAGAAAIPTHAQTLASPNWQVAAPAVACEIAIARAQARYALPSGLLLAIGIAESGRADPATGRMRPWPWAVQTGGRSLYFDTRDEAVAWVENAQASGTLSVDIGCLQVNLMYHPKAFSTVDAAFDPDGNVDYAARFLVSLHDETKDWPQATGFYHSRTPGLALSYQLRVQTNMGMPSSASLAASESEQSVVDQLAVAWGATAATAADAVPAGEGSSGSDWSTLLQRRLGPPASTSLSRRRVADPFGTR